MRRIRRFIPLRIQSTWSISKVDSVLTGRGQGQRKMREKKRVEQSEEVKNSSGSKVVMSGLENVRVSNGSVPCGVCARCLFDVHGPIKPKEWVFPIGG